MGKDGKYRYDSGRARSMRDKERAQYEFDDMLIDQYLSQQDPKEVHERQTLPVRFGSTRLSEVDSDASVATAVLEEDNPAPIDSDDSEAQRGLFDQPIADSEPPPREVLQTSEPSPTIAVATTATNSSTCPFAPAGLTEKRGMDMVKLARGFLIGAGTSAVLLLLWLKVF